ncbi:17114_t:CDS:2, partial [Racocetra persica]
VAEEHISNYRLDLIKKIEAHCEQSKTTVNQNIDLAYNLWKKSSAKPNKKEQLRSDLIVWIKKENGSWIGLNMAKTIGKPFIQDLTDVFWYIDGYEEAKEEEVSNQHYKIKPEIKKWFPIYHTRRIYKEYIDMCDLYLNKQLKTKLRYIYKELTNDALAAKMTSQKK